MLSKVMKTREKALARTRRATDTRSAQEKLTALRKSKQGNSKAAIEEARRLKLGDLAYSKPSEHDTGFNYGVDARKQRKVDKPAANKYSKPSDFGTRTATWGSKTADGINAYYRNKGGDNLPRPTKK